jgi:hypothetical protein
MEQVTDNDLIIAAVLFGARLGRREAVSTLLGGYSLDLTSEMITRLDGYQPGLTLSGYEPFAPIADLDVSADIHNKLLGKNPRILIIAQLSELTAEDLADRYELTAEEVDEVKRAFEFAQWRLRPSSSPPS